MSGKELDNLFRNKLEDHQQAPSSEAWGKLQAGLGGQQKKISYPYWRVAAAILLLISSGVVFWWVQSMSVDINVAKLDPIEEAKDSLADQNLAVVSPEEGVTTENNLGEERNDIEANRDIEKAPDKVEDSQDVEPSILQENAAPEQQTTESKDVVKNTTSVAANTHKEVQQPELQMTEDVVEHSEVMVSRTDAQQVAQVEQNQTPVKQENNTPAETAVQEKKSTTLVFDIEDFDKKTAIASANNNNEEAEVKQSKFKKILNFVKNVKEGGGGLGELREAKNELFTFDSKREENDSE